MASSMAAAYDRTAELRVLEVTFSGIRGVVASYITHLPRILRDPTTTTNHRHRKHPP